MGFKSTKSFGPISTCHRNWMAASNENRDSRKCSWIHGYSRRVKITFEGDLDEFTWVQDFGDLKELKNMIEDAWDHKVLIASNDPMLDTILEMDRLNLIKVTVMDVTKGYGPGIETSCKWVADIANNLVGTKSNGRVKVSKVEIWEHENNSAIWEATV